MAVVEHYSEPFPWRTATLVASAIAGVELIGLVVVGAFLVAHPFRHHATQPAAAVAPATVVARVARPAVHRQAAPIPAKDRVAVVSHPLGPRSRMRVLVLNANGVTGAAHAEAARLQSLGYRVGGAENAPRHDYGRSMVMYVPGYAKEGRRLAHDTGIRLVAPIDGLTRAALAGSRLVVLLGS